MSTFSKLIKNGDALNVKLKLLYNISEGRLLTFQVENIIKRIEKFSLSDDVFLPYINFDGIKTDKDKWNKNYLLELKRETIATGKFDKEFVIHMSEVSEHVYRNRHIVSGAGIVAGIIGVSVILMIILK